MCLGDGRRQRRVMIRALRVRLREIDSKGREARVRDPRRKIFNACLKFKQKLDDMDMKKLKSLRELSGLTLRELGERSCINYGDLCRAEAGKLKLSPYHVFLIRKILTTEIALRDGKIHELLGAEVRV